MVRETLHLVPEQGYHADGLVALEHGHGEQGAHLADFHGREPVRIARAIRIFVHEVLDLHRYALPGGTADQHDRIVERIRIRMQVFNHLGARTGVGDIVQVAVPEQEQTTEGGAAQAGRVVQDDIEHRLVVGGRLADAAQDLAGRGLALQELTQFRGASLQDLEQAHVLDRDHGLVGEGAHQLDVFLLERLHVLSVQCQYAHDLVAFEHRYAEQGAHTSEFHGGQSRTVTRAIDVVGGVEALNGLAFPRRGTRHAFGATHRQRIRLEIVDQLGSCAQIRRHVQVAVPDQEQDTERGATQTDGVLDDGFEDRCVIGG